MAQSTTKIRADLVDEINILETIDGGDTIEISTPEDSPKRRKSSAQTSASAKTNVNKADRHIWAIYIIMLIISVIELYSASSREVTGTNVYMPLLRHVQFLVAGLIIVLFIQRIHYKWFRKCAWALGIVTILLLIYTYFFGANINNAQRAIKIGSFTFQTPEMAKLTIMLLLAAILAKHQMRGGVNTRGVVYCAAAVLAYCVLTFNSGLTNTVIIMGVSACMFIIGGIKWKKIGVVLLFYVVVGGLAYYVRNMDDDEALNTQVTVVDGKKEVDRSEVHEGRLQAYLKGVSPTDSMTDANRQAMMSRFAQAHGGVVGQGLGKSRETARLPLAFSDYIFAIIIEEAGLIGGILLIVLYLLLLARAGKIASQCSRAFPALLIMGCAVLIVFQALVHMSIVTGVAPVSGQPLPFISKGGTSVLVFSAVIGMMLSVSKYAVRTGDKKEINAEIHELPEDIKAENPSLISVKTN